MSDYVDSIQFVRIDGELQGTGVSVEDITRPYTDGVAFRKIAIRPAPEEIICGRDLTNYSDLETLRGNCKDLQGELVTIQKAGISYSNRLVLDAEIVSSQGGAIGVGGIVGGRIWVNVRFRLIYAGVV